MDCQTEFNPSYFVLKTKAKKIENSSADYQTKDIICSMDCKMSQRILILYILFEKNAKEVENSSANN